MKIHEEAKIAKEAAKKSQKGWKKRLIMILNIILQFNALYLT